MHASAFPVQSVRKRQFFCIDFAVWIEPGGTGALGRGAVRARAGQHTLSQYRTWRRARIPTDGEKLGGVRNRDEGVEMTAGNGFDSAVESLVLVEGRTVDGAGLVYLG
eukprot:1923228-Rhodomonas_salina.1